MRKACLGVGGGGMAPALTARKFGIRPKIRLGCCLEGATDLLAVSEAEEIALAEVGDSVFVDDGVCGAVVWDEGSSAAAGVSDVFSAGVLGIVAGSWASLSRGSIHTRTTKTTVLIETFVNKDPPELFVPILKLR